jgi:UDP-N-acetylmuramoyl-L-alanyl-D-glutamate--2,6-diaminopimelate ligase
LRVRLTTLLDVLPDVQWEGPADTSVSEIAYDSRLVTPGTLFVAVPTVGQDANSGGVRFWREAAERGAVAAVVPADAEDIGMPVVRVPDARAALADLSSRFFNYPSHQLRLFGITGTDGKTTSAYLTEQIFSHAGACTGLLGTVETKVGGERSRNPERMTTPESLDLQRLLREMVERGVTHAALEASSHALVLQRLRGCRFEAAGLTNITGDHVEFHGSWEAYVVAKQSLFTQAAPGRPAVLNRDDDSYPGIAQAVTGLLISYSTERGDADIVATDIAVGPTGTTFRLSRGNHSAPVSFPLLGRFNVSNALLAAGLALAAEIDLETIAEALSHASPPPGRQERIRAGQPFEVVIDYAHTPHAFHSILSTARAFTRGRLIVVFGAAGNRDRAKRPLLAQIAGRYADRAVVTNEDPFGEDPEAIIDEILAGVPAGALGTRFIREPDRGRAIEAAMRDAGPGDTVLILGKGHERSIVANGRNEAWSDAEAVRDALPA